MEGISVDSSALFVDSSAKDDVEGSEGEAAFLSADDADGGWRGTVTHALMAHEDATAAEDASSLEAARLKHLGASKNFLAAAEDCCEESTKRSLLLLSRAHARAAVQAGERMKRGAVGRADDRGALESSEEGSSGAASSSSDAAAGKDALRPQLAVSANQPLTDTPATQVPPQRATGGKATREFLALEKVLARFGARPQRQQDHIASSMAESLSASVSMMGSSSLQKSSTPEVDRGATLGESFVMSPPSSGVSRSLASGLPTPKSLRESLTLSSINEAHGRRQNQLHRARTGEQSGLASVTEAQQRKETPPLVSLSMKQQRRQKQQHPEGGRFVPSEEYAMQQAELLRCLKTTQLLHDENAKLLDDNQELRDKVRVAQQIDAFKSDYSVKFKKVKDELLKFREAYPHLKNPAATVPNAAEKQVRQLAAAYEKKARKLKESEASNMKLQRRVQEGEAKLKQYEAAFRKLSRRVAWKRAHSEEGGAKRADNSGGSAGDGAATRGNRQLMDNREQLVRQNSTATHDWEREQLKLKLKQQQQQRLITKPRQMQQQQQQQQRAQYHGSRKSSGEGGGGGGGGGRG